MKIQALCCIIVAYHQQDNVNVIAWFTRPKQTTADTTKH